MFETTNQLRIFQWSQICFHWLQGKKDSLHRSKFDPISTDWKIHLDSEYTPEHVPGKETISVPTIISRFKVFARVPFPKKTETQVNGIFWLTQVGESDFPWCTERFTASGNNTCLHLWIWESLPFQGAQLGKGTKSKIDLLKIQVLSKMHASKNAFQVHFKNIQKCIPDSTWIPLMIGTSEKIAWWAWCCW